jgi:hypothetical protein
MVPALPLPNESDPPELVLLEGLPPAAPRAETAECACPEFCERDHDRD